LLRLDLHVHTTHSRDAFCSVAEAVRAARAKGLDGIAITDHDSIGGHPEAKKLSRDGFLVIPGIEVSSADGHILGLGVNELVPRGLPAGETVKLIRKLGGIAVAAHPFIPWKKPTLVYKAKFDAIEAFNSHALFPSNRLARRFAEQNRLPGIAGSDAHFPDEVGLASVKLNCEKNVKSILREIKRGRASISGRTLPLPSQLKRIFHKIFLKRAL
jgi:hypothetical protein